jgi:O-antigen/teichoic acid export membrane protein
MATEAGFLAASEYVATGLGFLTTTIAARLLGPSEYGIATMAMAYPTLLSTFAAVKTVSVTTRYISSFRATGRNAELKSICKFGYGLDLISAVAAFILVAATSWWVARNFLNVPEMSWLMIAYAASLPLYSLAGTSSAILLSWQEFRWLARLQILNKAIALIAIVALLSTGMGVPAVVLGTALGQATNGLMLTAVATYVLHRDRACFWWSASLRHITPLRSELTAFSVWSYLATTLSGLMAQVPLMLLGRFRAPEEAGFYRLAMTLTTASSYLESSLGRIAYPVLSARWAAGDREQLIYMVNRWTLRGGLPAGVLLLLVIPLGPIMIPMAFGFSYSPMIPGLQVMMIGAVASTVFFWQTSLYFASGKIATWTKSYGLYTISILALSYFCIRQWGFLGIAWLFTVGKVLFVVLMVVLISQGFSTKTGQD